MTDEARDETYTPASGLPAAMDLEDPMVYRLMDELHVPEEERFFHVGGAGPGRIKCAKDFEEWPCAVRRAIRDVPQSHGWSRSDYAIEYADLRLRYEDLKRVNQRLVADLSTLSERIKDLGK